MKIIDLRIIGPLLYCDGVYLARLIASTCDQDYLKHSISL